MLLFELLSCPCHLLWSHCPLFPSPSPYTFYVVLQVNPFVPYHQSCWGFLIQVVSVIIIIIIVIIGIINQSGWQEDFDSNIYIFVTVGKGHLHLVKFSTSLGDDLVISIMLLLFCLLFFVCESSKAVGGTCGGDW